MGRNAYLRVGRLGSFEFDRNPSYVELVFGVVLVWGFCDSVSTLTAASFAGHYLEVNPLVRALLPDLYRVLALKHGTALVAGVLALVGQPFVRSAPGWRPWFLSLIGVGLGVTVVNLLVAFV